MINVLIVDDHALVRAGLKQILASYPDVNAAADAGNGQAALERIRSVAFDVAVVDLTMPGLSGIDLIKRLKQERPRCQVVVLSMHKEDQFALRALRAGASGYLTKDAAPELLVDAIRTAARGGKYITPALAEQLAQSLDRPALTTPHESLSDREHQVFHMLVSGKPITEIAAELSLSPKTVSTHKLRVMQKLGVDNNAAMIQYALTHRIFD